MKKHRCLSSLACQFVMHNSGIFSPLEPTIWLLNLR